MTFFEELQAERSRPGVGFHGPTVEQTTTPLYAKDALSAAWDLAQEDTALNSVYQIIQMYDLQGQESTFAKSALNKKISPEEANEKFPHVAKPFIEPVSFLTAHEMNERALEKKKKQAIINGADLGGAFSTLVPLGASLLAHAADPIELGAGLLTAGVAAPRFAPLLKNASLLKKMGYTAIEGAAGNLLAEPFILFKSAQERSDYGLQDAFIGSVGGALGVSLLVHGVGSFVKFLRNMPDKTAAYYAKQAIDHVNAGRRPDVEQITKSFFERGRSVEGFGNVLSDYKFKKITATDIPNTKFYAATHEAIGDIRSGTQYNMGRNFGEGMYVSDSPVVANMYAANHIEVSKGALHEVNIKKGHLVDLDLPLRPDIEDSFKAFLKKEFNLSDARIKKLLEGRGLDVMDKVQHSTNIGGLPDDAFEKINTFFKDQGFDGYHYNDPDFLQTGSKEIQPHNSVFLFDADSVEHTRSFSADTEALKPVGSDELEEIVNKYDDPDNMLLRDKQFKEEFERLPDEVSEVDATVLRRENEARIEELNAMEQQGTLSPETRQELTTLRKDIKEQEAFESMVKASIFCVRNK